MRTKSAPDLPLASPDTDGVRESNSHARGPAVVLSYYYPRQEARKASEAAGTRHCGRQARRDETRRLRRDEGALLVRAAGVQSRRQAGRGVREGRRKSRRESGVRRRFSFCCFHSTQKGKCRRRAVTGHPRQFSAGGPPIAVAVWAAAPFDVSPLSC